MPFIILIIFWVVLFTILTSITFGIASLLAYIFESLTLADAFTPTILLMMLTAYILIEATKMNDRQEEKEENELLEEPIIVFPSRRQFRGKSRREKKT